MKVFTIDIDPMLKDVKVAVKNGKAFTEALTRGEYRYFSIQVDTYDLSRIKKFAVKHGNDNSSNRGHWYAHCNGYSMGLTVTNKGNDISINTYRPHGIPASAHKKLRTK